MKQTHIRAVNKTINALRLDQNERYSANVEIARTLARQMDDAALEPSTRLVAAYLSALKDLQRARPVQLEETKQSTNESSRLELFKLKSSAMTKATRDGRTDEWMEYLPEELSDMDRYLIEYAL